MPQLSVTDLERFRAKLLAHARELHVSRGLSPREDLSPAKLVEGALERLRLLTRRA